MNEIMSDSILWQHLLQTDLKMWLAAYLLQTDMKMWEVIGPFSSPNIQGCFLWPVPQANVHVGSI